MTGATARLRQAWDRQLTGLPGRFGLDLRSLDRPVLARHADGPHYAASTIKLAVLAALLQSRGDAWPAAVGIPVHSRFPSVAGGSFEVRKADDQDDHTWAHEGREVDLVRLAERMTTVSGNLAADLIIEHLGLNAINGFLDRAGLGTVITLDRLIGDDAAEAAGVTNSVTAAGLARLMAGIADHSLLGGAASGTALEVLAGQEHRRMIPAGLPPGTWSASKGGWVTGVAHDVALVRPDTAPPYVLAICTTTGLDDTDGQALVARLSAVTWEHWTTWHA